jgi:sulfate adenylyltransferase large subunit
MMDTDDGARERELIEHDIQGFLARNLQKELLRFTTVGSVDDGKSTLIGRLLHDTKGVFDDQLQDATRTSASGEAEIDFSRLTDGLRAEREQGITIDVAYRYFSTPRRKFIIADTPGHVQYTRNMATGASTANVALVLIDARLGVLEQSRRHGYIASLLGIPHLLVCVNKMDLVGYDQARFDEIVAEFRAFTDSLGFKSVDFVPVSALLGVNIVHRSPQNTPWYTGPSILEFLETVEIAGDIELGRFRFPVQFVLRPDLHYRGFAGQIASGVVRVGDEITVLPSGKTTRVTHIDTYDGELEEAFAPMSVTLRLADEIDISRGDLLVARHDVPLRGRRVDAMVVWMNETPLDPGKTYLIKHTTRLLRTGIAEVAWKVRLETLEQESSDGLRLNDIGLVRLDAHADLCFDPYRQNRPMGAFILIDSKTNTTVAAGMLLGVTDLAGAALRPADGESQVSATERRLRLGHPAALLCLGGLDPKARQRVAWAVERRLFDLGALPAVTDDPNVAGALLRAGLAVVSTSPMAGGTEVLLQPEDAQEDRLEHTAERLADRLVGRAR